MSFATTLLRLLLAGRTLCSTLAFFFAAGSLVAAEAAGDSVLPEPIWLSDLPEKNVQVGYGSFGKNGWAGFEPIVISSQGHNSHHSLGMHPDAHVEYVLDKKYRSFRGTAAMNYSCEPHCERPVIFRVLLDGKQVWESHGMHHARSRQPCLLDVTGANVLRLEVLYRPGSQGDGSRAHGVWIDPYVAVTAPSPKALPLFQCEGYKASERSQDFIYRVQKLMVKEDFNELEKLAQGCRDNEEFADGDPLLSYFYLAALKSYFDKPDHWTSDFARLERWKKAKPDSLTPLVLFAETYNRYAWDARGHGFASEVTNEGWKLFHERLAKGRKYIEEAMSKKLADGELYAIAINYELDSDSPRDKIIEFFRRGKNLSKRYYTIYDRLANYLLPRWHGAPGELQETAAAFRELLGGELGDEVYFRMACTELNTLDDQFFSHSEYNYDWLKAGFWASMRHFNDVDSYINKACLLACIKGDKETARLLFQRLDMATMDYLTWKTTARYERWRTKFGAQLGAMEEKQVIEDPSESWVLFLAFSGDKQLWTAPRNGPLRRWDLANGKVDRSIEGDKFVRIMSVDAAGKTALVCYATEEELFAGAAVQPLDGSPARPITTHAAPITSVCISRDGTHCGTVSLDKTARLAKIDDLNHPVVLKHPEAVFDVTFSPDGKLAATTCWTGGLWIWNADTGDAVGKPLRQLGEGYCDGFVRFLPSGKQVVLASGLGGAIETWDLATRKKKQELHSRPEELTSCDVSPDGRWLALGRGSGKVEVYSLAPLALAHTYIAHHSRCNAVTFSPDGKTLASCSCDCDAKLWPIDKLKTPPPLPVPMVPAGVTIVKAEWGGGKIWADVTKKVLEGVSAGQDVWATVDWLKSDPTPHWRKHLKVSYTKDGTNKAIWKDEGAVIKLEEFK